MKPKSQNLSAQGVDPRRAMAEKNGKKIFSRIFGSTPSQEAFSLDLNCDSFWDLCWAKITEHKFSYAKNNLRIKALELQIGQVFEIVYNSLRANIKRRNLAHLIAHFCSSSREYFVGDLFDVL